MGAHVEQPASKARGKVTDDIIVALTEDIASHRLVRGSRLPSERELASQFQVSQPTMREAIRALDAMGLVDVRHGSGVFVSADISRYVSTSLSTLLQIEQVGILESLEVREVLGRFSAARAAQHATEEELDQLLELAERCDAATKRGTVPEMTEAVVVFQTTLSEASHNPLLTAVESFLIRLLMDLQRTAKARSSVKSWRTQLQMFTSDRADLVRSLVARDAEAAAAAMTEYLLHQRRHFEKDEDLSQSQALGKRSEVGQL